MVASRAMSRRLVGCAILGCVLCLPGVPWPGGPGSGLPGWLSGRAAAQAFGDLALAWTLGDFRSPLLCEVEGSPFRVLRRVRISPRRATGHRPTVRVQFYDLDSPGETRCYSEEGEPEQNLIGVLEIIHEARRDRTDLAEREFTELLRREGGFRFKIKTGVLRQGTPGVDPEDLALVDYSEGTLEVRQVERGQDAFRRLADFGDRRKLTLRIEAPDGTTLRFDLAQLGR